jgi:MerR family redox-sensitive transcriptional activator SoxR
LQPFLVVLPHRTTSSKLEVKENLVVAKTEPINGNKRNNGGGLMTTTEWLTIGELADRAGVATSALRFYEDKGLIESERTEGNQRRYARSALRRVALLRAAQAVGLSLSEAADALETLPHDRTPNKRDWQRLSRSWRRRLDDQIADLELLRDELTDCIGCGCLSLRSCAIFNPKDTVSDHGAGARYLLGDEKSAERISG